MWATKGFQLDHHAAYTVKPGRILMLYYTYRMKMKEWEHIAIIHLKEREIRRQTVNLLDVMEDPVDSRHGSELELVSPLDDETCRLHQIYNLWSSYRTDILVGRASQERHSPSAVDEDP